MDEPSVIVCKILFAFCDVCASVPFPDSDSSIHRCICHWMDGWAALFRRASLYEVVVSDSFSTEVVTVVEPDLNDSRLHSLLSHVGRRQWWPPSLPGQSLPWSLSRSASKVSVCFVWALTDETNFSIFASILSWDGVNSTEHAALLTGRVMSLSCGIWRREAERAYR